MAYDVDSLRIQIEAESSNAAKQVNALTTALIGLKEVLGGTNFGSITSQIQQIGKSAQQATLQINKGEKGRKEPVKEGADFPTDRIDKTIASYDDILEKINEINRAKISGPDTKAPNSNIEKVNKLLQSAEVNTERTGNKFTELQRKLDQLKGIDTKNIDLSSAIEKATSRQKEFSEAIDKTQESVKRLQTLLYDLLNSQTDFGAFPRVTKWDIKSAIDDYNRNKFEEGIAKQKAGLAISEAGKQAKLGSQGLGNINSWIGKSDTQLSKYEAQILSVSEKLDSLKLRLQELESKKGISAFSDKEIDKATQKISEFESKIEITKNSADALRKAIADVGSGTKNISPNELRELINGYKSASEVAKTFGKVASDSVKSAESAVKSVEKEISSGFNKALSSLKKVDLSSIVDISKLDAKFSSLSETMNNLKSVQMLPKEDYDKLDTAQQKMDSFGDAIKTANILSGQLGIALRGISDGSINMSTKAIQDLVDAYKLTKANASAAGESAKAAMDIAKNAVKSAETAIRDYNKALQSASDTTGKGFADISKIESQVKKLQSKLTDLQNIKGIGILAGPEIKNAAKKVLEFQMAASFAAQELENVKAKLDNIKTGKFQASKEELEKLTDEYKKLKQAAEEYGASAKGALDSAKDKAKESSESIKEIKQRLSMPLGEGLKSLITSALDLDRIKTKIAEIASAAPKLGIALQAAFMVFNSAINFAKKGIQGFISIIDKAAKSVYKLSKELAGLYVSGLKGIGKQFINVGKIMIGDFIKPFMSAIKVINTWKKSLGRIAFYRAVRGAIKAVTDGFKTGIQNLYQYSSLVGTQFKPAMDSLATSALYLKNSLGAMAAPLIQALAPAIDFLVDKFVALLNIIGKVFAALTGKTVYTQAKKHAVEYADAAKEATQATKDFTIGIDELNVISENAGGAAGAAEDFGSMFEEVEVPNEITEWAEQIREAIENGEWQRVGELIAEKLNEVVDSWDSYAWGQKLGNAINNGLNVAYGFMSTFDFRNLGYKVGEALMGIFDEIDWELLGNTFAEKWNALFDFIAGLLDSWEPRVADIGKGLAAAVNGWFDGIHWEEIAETISRGIIFIANLIEETFKNIQWDNIGKDFAAFLNNINWYGIITSVSDAIIEGFNGLKEVIDNFLSSWNWEDSAQQIYKAINYALSKMAKYAKGWGETIGNVFKTSFDYLRTIISGIKWEQLGYDVAQFIMGIDWQGVAQKLIALLKAIWDGVSSAIKTAIDTLPKDVLGWLGAAFLAVTVGLPKLLASSKLQAIIIFNEFGEEIKKIVKSTIDVINDAVRNADWNSIGREFGNGLKNLFETISILIGDIDWVAIVRSIFNFLAGVDWVGLAMDLVDIIMNAIGALAEIIIGLVTSLPDIIKIGVEIITGIGLGIIKAVLELPAWLLKHVVRPIIDALVEFFGIGTGQGELFKLGKGIIQDIWDGVMSIVDGFIAFFRSVYEVIIAITEGDWGKVYDIITGKLDVSERESRVKLGNIRTNTETAFDGVALTTEKEFGKVKEAIVEPIEDASTETSEILNGMQISVSEDLNEILTDSTNISQETKETIVQSWVNTHNESIPEVEGLKTDTNKAFNELKEDVAKNSENWKKSIVESWRESRETTEKETEEMKTKAKGNFAEIESDANDKFPKIENHIRTSMENSDKETETHTESMKTKATENFEKIRSDAEEKFPKIEKDIKTAWDNSDKNTDKSWGNIANTVSKKVGEIWDSISSTFGRIVDDALQWGRDFVGNLVDGMESQQYKAGRAASGVAREIKQYIHFSEPDVGPLSDAHTYMPDMMKMFASGIEQNSFHVENAMSNFTGKIADDLANMPTAMEIGFQTHSDFNTSTAKSLNWEEKMNDNDVNETLTMDVRNANNDVVNAIYEMATNIVDAVSTLSNRPVNVNIGRKELVQQVERGQRERGVNIMRGGVNG